MAEPAPPIPGACSTKNLQRSGSWPSAAACTRGFGESDEREPARERLQQELGDRLFCVIVDGLADRRAGR